MKKVASELPGMSDLLLQHHMEVVTVPVGRLHAVSNLQHCLKLAVETIHEKELDLMQGVCRLQCEMPGLHKATDYVGSINLVLAQINSLWEAQ